MRSVWSVSLATPFAVSLDDSPENFIENGQNAEFLKHFLKICQNFPMEMTKMFKK